MSSVGSDAKRRAATGLGDSKRHVLSGVWRTNPSSQLLLVEDNQRVLAMLTTKGGAQFVGGGALSAPSTLSLRLVAVGKTELSEPLVLTLLLLDDTHLQSSSSVWTRRPRDALEVPWAPPLNTDRWDVKGASDAPQARGAGVIESGEYDDGTNVFRVCSNPSTGEFVWDQESGASFFFGVGLSLPHDRVLLFVAHLDPERAHTVARSPIAMLFRDMRASRFVRVRGGPVLNASESRVFPAFHDAAHEALAASSLSLFDVARWSTRGASGVLQTPPNACGVWSGPWAGQAPRLLAALHLACEHGNPKVVQSLLDQKADVNQRLPGSPHCSPEDAGSTPLLVTCRAAVREHKYAAAARRGSGQQWGLRAKRHRKHAHAWDFEGVVRVLLQHGANPLAHHAAADTDAVVQGEAPACDLPDSQQPESVFAVLRSAGALGQAISTQLRAHGQASRAESGRGWRRGV